MSDLRIAIAGASGRMGRAVARLAADEKWGTVVFAFAAAEAADGAIASSLDGLAASHAQVLIDFSAADICANVAAATADSGIALVSGTTGIGDDTRAAFDRAAERIPVLWEANMSVGVHVLAGLVAEAAKRLGPSFHAEIVELHHAAKVDAPSGTALLLADALEAGSGRWLDRVNGRAGRSGARPNDAIGIHAVRGGDVIGDHTVHLLGLGERIELTHRATNRDLFARGALRAAAGLVGRAPGRYRLADVILNK